ncbi:MAG TPA: PhzF family phenazine biosynthesis protein [Acetobacteraceae bacterium]|jgi:trans-2,3-dihydro-3-hydroxyanthranilate isomerase|nr:PhzF family phenazine biosynthesis protein [Acetobacteraceae bacterium]
MASYDFVTVNVFTDERFGGNPLAVLPDATGLTDAQMQAIAAEFNLSETTFVLPPDNPQHHARVRIFSRKSEMPFAGHPNVGTGFVLATIAGDPPEHYTFEEIAGLVRVHILRDANRQISGARIAAPRSLSIDIGIPVEVVAGCASLSPDDIATLSHTPLVASVGTPFVLAEVASVEALSRARPDLSAFRSAADEFAGMDGRFALYLYAWMPGDERRIRARMFAPLGGTPEDPATGSAAATLAALLTSIAPGDNVDLSYAIEQGVEMGRPSLILASAVKTGEGPVSASVAGSCVPVSRGTLVV